MSLGMCILTQNIIGWSELHMVSISAKYVLGKNDILADQLSLPYQVIPTEWPLHPQVIDDMCAGCLVIVFLICVEQGRTKVSVYVSCSGSRGMEARCLPALWDDLIVCDLPPFAFH